MQKELVWRNLLILSVSLIAFFFVTLFVANYVNRYNQEKELLYVADLFKDELTSVSSQNLSNEVYRLTDGQERYSIVLSDNLGEIKIDGASDHMGEGVLDRLSEKELSGFNESQNMPYVYIADGKMHCMVRFNNDLILRTSIAMVDNSEFIITSTFFLVVVLLVVMVISVMMTNNVSKTVVKTFSNINHHLKTIAGGQYSPISLNEPYPEVAEAYSEMNVVIQNIQSYIQNINAEKNKLDSVINNVGEGIIILDTNGFIVTINEFAKRFSKFSQGQTNHYTDNLKNQRFLALISKGLTEDYHTDFSTEDGKIYYVSFNHYVSGGDKLVSIVIFDVTAARIEERRRVEFLSNASHELKTPITSISGFSELLASGLINDSDKVKDYANRILTASIGMKATIDDLLYLSRIDNITDQSFKTEPINLADVIADCIANRQVLAENKRVEIVFEPKNVQIIGNRGFLGHMISNLIDNAIKYNVVGGKVIISLGKTEKGVSYLSVEDTGVGIDESHIEFIFDRFYRVDDSRNRATGGTGIGLTICKKIATLHGGDIAVESQLEKGTKFTVIFNRNNTLKEDKND